MPMYSAASINPSMHILVPTPMDAHVTAVTSRPGNNSYVHSAMYLSTGTLQPQIAEAVRLIKHARLCSQKPIQFKPPAHWHDWGVCGQTFYVVQGSSSRSCRSSYCWDIQCCCLMLTFSPFKTLSNTWLETLMLKA